MTCNKDLHREDFFWDKFKEKQPDMCDFTYRSIENYAVNIDIF